MRSESAKKIQINLIITSLQFTISKRNEPPPGQARPSQTRTEPNCAKKKEEGKIKKWKRKNYYRLQISSRNGLQQQQQQKTNLNKH